LTFKSRFAPSPTGLIHIGNARSAVLNWMHIKNKGGEFILRIDDTDTERSKLKYKEAIKNDLNWLGITWSKTFNQSDRKNIYQEKVKELKQKKRIYPCFETPEELSLKRKILLTAGKPPIYDRSALQLTEKEIQKKIDQGKQPHWRFKLEYKIIEWDDLIKGKVSFDSKNLSDPILIREDSSLLYHLPSVVDDIEEKITDVIRGEDHITNTAFHIQIFESLNAEIPFFGHHPYLIDQEGKSFSKRLGSLTIQQLKDRGFENITLLNYLLSIGTSKNLSNEKNIKNLINDFDIKNLATYSPKFSQEVLEILNKEILQTLEFSEVKQKFADMNLMNITEDFWVFVKNNINFFSEVMNWWNIIHSKEVYSSNEVSYLKVAAQLLPEEPFDISTWNKWTSEIKIKTGRIGKELYMPLRLALTGQTKGPELMYLMPLLKREHVLKKLGE